MGLPPEMVPKATPYYYYSTTTTTSVLHGPATVLHRFWKRTSHH